MSFELYIWGPAFGLPSIDPECLAATAYFKAALPPDQWILVSAYDPSWSPTADFPALKDGSAHIGGYRAIVQHLEAQGWSLRLSSTNDQSGDHIALVSHISANALPLLDCLLYTTPDSYVYTTRPAWSQVLPHSASAIIPPMRRSAAEIRTSMAGITFPSDAIGDLETLDDPNDPQAQRQRAAALQSNSPSLLFARKRTLQATLQKEAAATRIRLENMTCNFLEPLEAVLREAGGAGSSTNMSRLHCLAFGYLAIMFYAPVQHPWFAETVTARYPRIVAFITETRRAIFESGDDVKAEVVMSQAPLLYSSEPAPRSLSLPWRLPHPLPTTAILKTTIRQIFDFLVTPAQRWLLFAEPKPRSPSSSIPSLPILGLAAAPPLLTGIAYFVYATFFSASASAGSFWGGPDPDKHFGRPLYSNKLEGLGEAGAMLSVIGGF